MVNESKPIGSVILCGGESQRMGFDKFKLPVGNVTLVERVIGQLRPLVGRMVLAVGQRELDFEIPGVELVHDQHKAKGPLEGIRVGLSQLADSCDVAFVTACDVPNFHPEVFELLLDELGDREAAIPVGPPPANRVYGMTAVYRTDVHKQLERFILDDKLRVSGLANLLQARNVPIEKIKRIDPQLECLSNINSPDDYFALLKSLGLECSPELYQQLTG